MKIAHSLLAVVSLITVSFAHAASFSFDSAEVAALPALKEVSVKVTHGPQMAAVQPFAEVAFKHASCARQPLSATTEQVGNLLVVRVQNEPNARDCRAMPRDHDYLLQISSDFGLTTRVIVLNPLSRS